MFAPRADIHLGRLRSNFRALTNHVGNAKVLAIVKADGYGHGLLPVSRALAEAGVHGFGVALLQEALDLRAAGLSQMILHMGRFDRPTLDKYIQQDIRLTLHGSDDVLTLAAHHDSTGADYVVHLKVDTGMTRLGVPYAAAIEVLQEVKKLPFIRLEGIYSHFATADEEDLSYLRYQLARFTEFVHTVRKLSLDVKYFHVANSAALAREPKAIFNMVRPGILLYGVRPSEYVRPPFEVQPVMDLKAPLVMIKGVPRGTPVGYNRRFRAEEDTTAGILQIGYADGIQGSFSDTGLVELGHAVYPMIGGLSMDLCSIDLRGKEYPIGEEALLWGLSQDPRLRLEHQARLAGTIPYELMVRVGSRVERHYVED